jgi:integrase
MEVIWDELPTKKTRSPRWARTQHGSLKAFRDDTIKKYPHVAYMPQITHSMALGWMRQLDQKGFGAETYNHKLILLRSVFVPSAGTGVLRNPFDGIPSKRKTNVHREPFTEKELNTIISHCDDLFRPIFITGMCTAMRRGDCCMLKWESVDLKTGFITIDTSKTGETAEIPLFPLLREEIEKQPRKGIYIFPEAAEMYQVNNHGISWRLKQALKAADIETTRPSVNKKNASNVKGFHSLRTTWITMALTAGVPMELVRRVTGHSTVNIVLKHYFRPGREDFREALESALPQTLTGRTQTRVSPAEQLKELVDKADELDKEKLVEELTRIAEILAA